MFSPMGPCAGCSLPRGTQSILASASCRPIGLGSAAFAVVSSVLNVGSSLVFGPPQLALVRRVCGGFVCPSCWFVFGVGCGPSRWFFVVLCVRWFRIGFPLFGSEC